MVSLLSDQIDRLALSTRAISAIGTYTHTPVAGPFTRAVLSTHLGDLIRDIDSSELGLFSLQSSAEPKIGRAEFDGATPLRLTSSRRAATNKFKETEPEVYARAAIKCIDRYQTIRPMPRAYSQALGILEISAAARENIETLNQVLQQARLSDSQSMKHSIDEEERRINALQEHIQHLHQNKKHAMTIKGNLPPKEVMPTSTGWTFQSPTAMPRDGSTKDTSASRSKTLQFTDNLLDEKVDLGDISALSFTSSCTSTTARDTFPVTDDNQTIHDPLISLETIQGNQDDLQVQFSSPRRSQVNFSSALASSEFQRTTPQELLADTPARLESLDVGQMHIQLNSKVKSIMTRIWAAVGDTLIPGRSSDVSNGWHPGPEEIMTRLQTLSSFPSLAATTSSADSTRPTSQQILTAHLLVSLLACPPHFSLPLGKVKDILASNAEAHTSPSATAPSTSRILYGCVAKRLLKIERGGGEQIVEFDIPFSSS